MLTANESSRWDCTCGKAIRDEEGLGTDGSGHLWNDSEHSRENYMEGPG